MPEANHPLVVSAARGRLPSWSNVGQERRAHMARVSGLLARWADSMGLKDVDAERWRAVGYLHDALREVDPAALRERVPVSMAGLPGPVLHGPAAAERLRVDGVPDGELLRAVAYHTIGHASLGVFGRALYVADFLEPGRTFEPEWREELRGRMPGELDAVAREIVAARIRHIVDRGLDLLPSTVAFWNVLAGEAS